MRTWIRQNPLVLIGWFLILLGGWLLTADYTQATQPAPDHRVTICHRTNSDTNPYVQITVDYAAVDGVGGSDHSRHTGPVWNPTLKDQHVKWGDIIPPVEGVTPGLNWTDEGRRFYDNGCTSTPTSTPTDSPPASTEPTPTATATEVPSGEPSATPTITATPPEPSTSSPALTLPPTDTSSTTSRSEGNAIAVGIAVGLVIGSGIGAWLVLRRLRHQRR